MKKYSFIIGIPAHNEEKSIKNTLNASFNQKKGNFLLKNIVVYSDGSTDQTNNIVKKEKNKLIKLVDPIEKKGKTYAIKQLLKHARNNHVDFLIIVDADLRISNKNVFVSLLEHISSDDNIAAVSGFVSPLKPKTFVEKIGFFGFTLWESLIKNSGGKQLYFRSSDPLIVLRVNDFPETKINPYTYMHDEFYYLFCKKYGRRFAFEKKSHAHYQLAKNLNDYIRQTARYMASHMTKKEKALLKNFKYNFSLLDKLIALFKNIKYTPSIAICYFFLHFYIHLLITFKIYNFSNTWSHIESTK